MLNRVHAQTNALVLSQLPKCSPEPSNICFIHRNWEQQHLAAMHSAYAVNKAIEFVPF